jgi:hypothetical protein
MHPNSKATVKRYRTDCPHCSQLRPLSEHLYELGLICSYLGNLATYTNVDSSRLIETRTIGSWLKLAAELESVEVDAWKFETNDHVCEPSVDRVNSDSKHFTLYSTALTRFMFVSSALEEAYRLVDHRYEAIVDRIAIPPGKRARTSGLRAAALVDEVPESLLPTHFQHRASNYARVFYRYRMHYAAGLTGLPDDVASRQSQALHLVRNLRNHIAHGVFPLIDNPEYEHATDDLREDLVQLLNQSCRMSAMFIQMLLARFNDGFRSSEYRQMFDLVEEPEFEYFIANCTVGYLRHLHIRQRFTAHGAFDYQVRPWETDESK